MNWKQNLADYFGYKNFEDMDTSDRSVAEKSVELYQKELNEKLKNVGLSISDLAIEKQKKFERFEKWFDKTYPDVEKEVKGKNGGS